MINASNAKFAGREIAQIIFIYSLYKLKHLYIYTLILRLQIARNVIPYTSNLLSTKM